MSTQSLSIEGKNFQYEIVTYKAKSEELLKKNLVAKFGKSAIEILFGSRSKVDVDSLVNDARKDKQLAKNLNGEVEKLVRTTIENKLRKLYGKKETPPSDSPESPSPGSPPPASPSSPAPVAEEEEDDDDTEKNPPIVYAMHNDTKYAYITIAMQENLWELFNSNGARFKRMISNWWSMLKDPKKREKLGNWLMGTPSTASLGGDAAVNWIGNKLQANIDAKNQRKQWKQINKNKNAAERFDKREEKRRAKELDRVANGGQYRSFETATNYEEYKSRKHDEILNRGLERGMVSSKSSAHNRWNPRDFVGTEKQFNKQLITDFGEDIATGRKECDKVPGLTLKRLGITGDSRQATNAMKAFINSTDPKNHPADRYFAVAPYKDDSGRFKYLIGADEKTMKWLDKHPPEVGGGRFEESMNRNFQIKNTITYSQLKRMITESLEKDKSKVQGLEHYTENEIKKIVLDQILRRMDDAYVDKSEFNFEKIAIFGSRNRGTARSNSDLDVVIEYSGTMREDDVFNILHDEDEEYGYMDIDGIFIDVNPIREEETGTLEEYLKKAREYDRQFM